MSQPEFAIRTENLVKTYGLDLPVGSKPIHAVDGLALNVPAGSIYGLLGRNSSGKTTTIRMAMGLARPSSGRIEVLGLNPARDPERVTVLSQVGYVPEEKGLLGFNTRKLLDFNRTFYPDTWSDALARKAIDRLELSLDQPILRLSLGNKTKAALVCAIAQRSRLLILDEPTTGLDPVALDALLRLLVEDCTADGRTIFLSSHQLNEIEQIADYIGIMDRGKLLLEGPLDDIRASFRRVTVAGASLPTAGQGILTAKPVGEGIRSVGPAPITEGRGLQYVLQNAPAAFEEDLTRNGATIVDTSPLTLNEIFLELCRKEEGREDDTRESSTRTGIGGYRL